MEALYRLSYESILDNGAGDENRTHVIGLEGRGNNHYTTPANLVEGGGFEPPKAEPADLQSAPFGRSGNPPNVSRILPINIFMST